MDILIHCLRSFVEIIRSPPGKVYWILVIAVRYDNQNLQNILLCSYPVSWNTPWGIWLTVHNLCESDVFELGKGAIHHVLYQAFDPTMPCIVRIICWYQVQLDDSARRYERW